MTSPTPQNLAKDTTNATTGVAKKGASATGLNKQIRGVPLWGWIAIAVVGGVVVVYAKRAGDTKKAQAAAASKTTEQGAGYTTSGYIAPTTVAASTQILTNSEWATAAEADLIQKGNQGTAVTAAVQNYVNNKPLTQDQQVMINQAVKDIGPLPQLASGQNNNYSLLDTPKAGNIFGQAVYSLGGLLGLNDPSNKNAQYIDPFFNDVIDAGPISGMFNAFNQVVGGNVSGSLNPNISIPGLGNIGLNLGASNSGVNGGLSLPNIPITLPNGQVISIGGSGDASVSPNSTQNYTTYVVNDGDTLQSISQQFYGGTGGAQIIYSANSNKIPDMNDLAAGTVLQIPSISNYSPQS